MKNKELAQRIKILRNRKGFSQEELSERCGLSLRTIQRIENGETEPRGDSLKKLASVFDVTSDEIVDWTVQEDKGFLISFNLSALSFIFFPILGILVPLIIWISKKDKIQNLNKIAHELLNFQILWSIFFFIGFFFIIISEIIRVNQIEEVSMSMFRLRASLPIIFIVSTYTYNLIFIVMNSNRINREKQVFYRPIIRFLRK